MEQEQNHRNGITWRVISAEEEGKNGGKGTGNKKRKW